MAYLTLPLLDIVQRYKTVTSFSMGPKAFLCSAEYNMLKCDVKYGRLFEKLPRTHVIVISKAVSDDSVRP